MIITFIQFCRDGNLLGAQQLFQLNPNIDISAYNDWAFYLACNNGHLEVAQWLLQVSKEKEREINISAANEEVFRNVCSSGHLHVAQWLLQVCPTIRISANDEEAFRLACLNGYLKLAQWLLQVCPTIHISAYREYAFRYACVNGHLHVAKWLQQIKPYLYVIEYDENGNYKNYKIRSKEEANWEKRKYLLFIASNKEDNLLYRLPSDVAKMVIGYV